MIRLDATHRFVFCPPPLGKPDPNESRPLTGADTRRRVIQLGSKDNTCWYSIFNVLRNRLKAPNTKHLSERTFERIASSRRKAVTNYECSLPDVANQLSADIIKRQFSLITKKNLEQKIGLIRYLDKFDSNISVPLSAILPKFQIQNEFENLYDFLVDLKMNHCGKINESFFEKIGLNPQEIFDSIKQLDPYVYKGVYGFDWDRVSPSEKNALLDHMARLVSIKKYGLEISSWSPQQPIEKLIAELESRGPLGIGGRFGISHYANPPKKLERKIEGRDIYGWAKNAPKHVDPVNGHMILIVAAEKTPQKQLVYYIDPIDDSDPNDPSKQRIFVTNYSSLTSGDNICDLHGFLRNDAPASIGYAVCRGRPKEKIKLDVPLFNLQESYVSSQPSRLRQEIERQSAAVSPEHRFALLEKCKLGD